MRAYLGPCIRPARYEFGAADLARLVARLGAEVEGRTDDGRPALDIPAAVRVALREAGVDELVDGGVCTASSDAHFSYRRDGVTGRQATIVVASRVVRARMIDVAANLAEVRERIAAAARAAGRDPTR